jgi:CheY-like chemotaxis protein
MMSSVTGLNRVYTPVLDDPLRILVTDDDPILREFASVYLSTETASVETADCGEVALERLRQATFDILLVDIDMPGISGYQVIAAVRANPKLRSLPIVVVTSNEDVVSIDRAYEAGATSFVTKPVNWRLLAYQMRYVIRAHRLSQIDCPCRCENGRDRELAL